MRELIDKVNLNFKDIIKQLNEFKDIINKYYYINKNILDNYEVKNRNYQVLENIKQIIINNDIVTKLKNIKDNKNINDKINDILELYNKMNDINIKKEI